MIEIKERSLSYYVVNAITLNRVIASVFLLALEIVLVLILPKWEKDVKGVNRVLKETMLNLP